jgi:hypothetical protein
MRSSFLQSRRSPLAMSSPHSGTLANCQSPLRKATSRFDTLERSGFKRKSFIIEIRRPRAARLAGVIASLNNADGLDPVARNCELALSRELLADVQITREKFTAARAELEVARELFQKVPAPDGPRGLQRLEELSKRLRAAEKDKDNPDVPD